MFSSHVLSEFLFIYILFKKFVQISEMHRGKSTSSEKPREIEIRGSFWQKQRNQFESLKIYSL